MTVRPVRVTLVTANFLPHIGGIERFVETLANGLTRRGHEVSVVCCRYRRAPLAEVRDGYEVHRIRSSYFLDDHVGVPYPVPSPQGMVRQLRKQLVHSDVVHVNDAIYATSVATLLLARRLSIPSVLTQHVAFVPQKTGALNALQRMAIGTLGRSARLATITASYNPSVAEWAADAWGVANARVVPVGVEPAPIAGDRGGVRRSFGLSEDRFLALFIGRDVPKKGLGVFLAAADTPYDLIAVTDRQGAGPAGTVLLPFMSSDRIAELLSCVDAFVLPSEGEGIPLSLQEALGAGLPVVTTRHPGYERYLADGDVLFVERTPEAVRGAISRLTADRALRDDLAARSVAVAAEHFSVDAFVSAYEALYLEAIQVERS